MPIATLTQALNRAFGQLSSAMPLSGLAAVGTAATLLALAPAANAVVVMSPAANVAIPVTTSGIYINVVTGAAGTAAGTAGWDLNPWGSSNLFVWGDSPGGVVVAGGAVAALAEGSVVGPASSFAESPSAASAGNGWMLNGQNYFGFSFQNEGSGQLHYGYGIISVGSAFNASGRSVTALFYESQPGVGITVSPVPEPATYALMLGGLAAVGAWARRRQGRAAA